LSWLDASPLDVSPRETETPSTNRWLLAPKEKGMVAVPSCRFDLGNHGRDAHVGAQDFQNPGTGLWGGWVATAFDARVGGLPVASRSA
jgi:hypothetical protein